MDIWFDWAAFCFLASWPLAMGLAPWLMLYGQL